MNAGIPGLGLGGLFFILTALLAPAIELGRTIRGRSSAAAWATVGRQFAIAVAMVAAIELTVRGGLALAAIAGVEGAGGGRGVTALPVAPLAITAGLLAGLIATAKACQLAVRALERGLPGRALAALPAQPRLRVRGVTAMVSVCASLLVAAPELGPASTGRGALPDPAQRDCSSGAAESVKRNALPPPSAGSTQMRPPWASTIRRQTASPIPMPSVRRSTRENRSKILLECSGSTPMPLSRTVTTHS
jgi:hypothetical protein